MNAQSENEQSGSNSLDLTSGIQHELGRTPKQLKSVHVVEHRKLFPNSNPVQIEGCCCWVAVEYRKLISCDVCKEFSGHIEGCPNHPDYFRDCLMDAKAEGRNE